MRYVSTARLIILKQMVGDAKDRLEKLVDKGRAMLPILYVSSGILMIFLCRRLIIYGLDLVDSQTKNMLFKQM